MRKEENTNAIITAVVKAIALSFPGAVGMGVVIFIIQACAYFGAAVFGSCSTSLEDPIKLDPYGLADFNFSMMCFSGYFIALGIQLWFFLSEDELKFSHSDYTNMNLHEISITLLVVCLIVSVIIYPKLLLGLFLGIPMLILFLANHR